MTLHRSLILSLVSLAGSILFGQEIPPDADSASHGVARVSIVTGDVSVRRNDSGEYVAAVVNAPVTAGAAIATGSAGRTELQFDSSNMLRIGHDSEVRLTDLQVNRIGMQIARGTITYRVLRESGTQVEIGTPTVSVRPMSGGAVRVSVLEDGQTEITARAGQVEIYTPQGVETLAAGQTMMARGSASDPEFQIVAAIPRDAWDEWNESRDRVLSSSPSYQRVSGDISGAEDLDQYGQWVNDPSYGEVWSPQVAADWAPYRNGRWVSDDYYGWSWLGDEPWGWAPYHYGNWFRGSSGWCWYPGSRYSRHSWRPAVVGFFGFGGRSGGFGFGFGNVGWAPLAPFETYRPWYGRGRGFNVVHNANIYGSFRNARHGGLTGIDSRNFSGGRSRGNFAVSRNQLSQAGMVQGGLPFRASGESRRFSDRQASHVPRGNSFSRQFASRSGSQPLGNTGRSTAFNRGSVQSGTGNRDSGWNRFGSSRSGTATSPQQNGRSLQSSPGNRDSGWNRFGSSRSGTATSPQQNGRSLQSSPGNRDSGWNRFGSSRSGTATSPQQNGRSLQSVTGNRDSGWNRFGSSRSGTATSPQQNGRSFQSSPGNRDFGSSRFGGSRSGTATSPQASGRSFQPSPSNRDFGSSRFGGSRGGTVTPPQASGRSFQPSPGNRDFGSSRFGGSRGGTVTPPQASGRSFQPSPSSRDFGSSRFGGSQGGTVTPPSNRDFGGRRFGGSQSGVAPQPQSRSFQSPPANRNYDSGRFGGSRGGSGSSSRGSMSMAAPPRQSPQPSRSFDSRPSGRSNYGSSSARSAPSYSGNNSSRGASSAPRSSGSNSNSGSHRGRRDR